MRGVDLVTAVHVARAQEGLLLRVRVGVRARARARVRASVHRKASC